jgi:hypothetical protein
MCVCQASVNAFVGTVVDLRRVLDSATEANEDHRQAVRMHWKAHSMGCHLTLGLVERLHWAKEPLRNLFARVRGPPTVQSARTWLGQTQALSPRSPRKLAERNKRLFRFVGQTRLCQTCTAHLSDNSCTVNLSDCLYRKPKRPQVL